MRESTTQIAASVRRKFSDWKEASGDLGSAERAGIALRTAFQLVPFGIGAAIVEGYWGTLDTRWKRKVEETLDFLIVELEQANPDVNAVKQFCETDEFAELFEGTMLRIRIESQQMKLQALRGSLASIITRFPNFNHEKRTFFLASLDRMGDLHIQLLQILRGYLENQHESAHFLEMSRLYQLVGATTISDKDFVFAAIDHHAQFRYVRHGNIPRKGVEGEIDFDRQRFRCTELGAQFLDFVRLGSRSDTDS